MEKNFREYWLLSLKIIGTITGIIMFFWFVNQVMWVISLFLISVLIVYAITPVTDWLETIKLSRTSASVITFSSLILIIIGLFYFTIPRFYSEIMELANYVPWLFEYIEAEGYLEEFQYFMEEYPLENGIHGNGALLPALEEASRHLFQGIVRLVTTFFEVLLLFFLVFYMLKDLKQLKNGMISIVPKRYQQNAVQILEVIDLKVGQFLRGNLIRCTLVGIITGIGLFFIGIRFHFILAIIAAILNIIVYIGPFIASIPAVLIALSYSLETAIIVAILYIIIQSLDAFIIYPVLLGRAVDLTPFSIIIAISIGGAIYGVIGFIISVPIAAILKVLYHYYINDDTSNHID